MSIEFAANLCFALQRSAMYLVDDYVGLYISLRWSEGLDRSRRSINIGPYGTLGDARCGSYNSREGFLPSRFQLQ